MNSLNSTLAAIIAQWQDHLVIFSALRGFSPGTPQFCGRRGGLMVIALNSRANCLGLGPGQGSCVVFLGKTLYSHGASDCTQVYNWVQGNMLGVTL